MAFLIDMNEQEEKAYELGLADGWDNRQLRVKAFSTITESRAYEQGKMDGLEALTGSIEDAHSNG